MTTIEKLKMKKIPWYRFYKMIKPDWSINQFGKQKALMAFEFGIVLSEVAKEMKIEMTKEIVTRAENLLESELKFNAENFACNMNVYVLAILEPKD